MYCTTSASGKLGEALLGVAGRNYRRRLSPAPKTNDRVTFLTDKPLVLRRLGSCWLSGILRGSQNRPSLDKFKQVNCTNANNDPLSLLPHVSSIHDDEPQRLGKIQQGFCESLFPNCTPCQVQNCIMKGSEDFRGGVVGQAPLSFLDAPPANQGGALPLFAQSGYELSPQRE